MYLAVAPEKKHKVQYIANDFNISRSHVMKVVTDLAAKGYVHASRGRYGGLQLNKPAGAILLGNVVQDMEPSLNLVDCSDCRILESCRLKSALHDSCRAFIHAMNHYTLADLVSNDKQLISLVG